MKLRLAWLVLLLTFAKVALGYTTVIAKPVQDAQGNAAFEIVKVLRVDGKWKRPPAVGMVLYPAKVQPAYPLSRFGEAVVITFFYDGHMDYWQGVHVYNGYIPALNGESLADLLHEINHEQAAPVRATTSVAGPEADGRICPICGKPHLHI